MTDEVRNVIIIGSGPAGYTAGLYSARALLEPLMFAGYMSGGQLMLTSDIENFPGYPDGIGGPEMMIQLREQAEKFGLEVQDKNVEKVDFSEQPFKIWVEGELFLTKSVIICTGAESIWLGAEGEEEQTKVTMEQAIENLNNNLELNVPLGVDAQFGKTYADIH